MLLSSERVSSWKQSLETRRCLVRSCDENLTYILPSRELCFSTRRAPPGTISISKEPSFTLGLHGQCTSSCFSVIAFLLLSIRLALYWRRKDSEEASGAKLVLAWTPGNTGQAFLRSGVSNIWLEDCRHLLELLVYLRDEIPQHIFIFKYRHIISSFKAPHGSPSNWSQKGSPQGIVSINPQCKQ